MKFWAAVGSSYGKYARFSGRASRSEFWKFYLFVSAISLVCYWLAAFFTNMAEAASANGEPTEGWVGAARTTLVLWVVVVFGSVLPLFAAWVRRLHDTGRSGGWVLLNFIYLGIVPFVMACFRSQPGTNVYGPHPYTAQTALPPRNY